MLQNGDTYKKKYCQEWYINDSKWKWKNRKTSKPLADNKSASKWKHLEIKKYILSRMRNASKSKWKK